MLKLPSEIASEAFRYYRTGRLREAETTLLQIQKFSPENWLLLAQIRLAKGRWQCALQALKELPAEYLHVHTLCNVLLGNAYKELDRFPEALDAYNRALINQPDFVPSLTNRAALHVLMGNLDQAEADLLNALRLIPDFPDANFHLAGIRLHQGNFAAGWILYESRWHTTLSPKLGRFYDLGKRWGGEFEELNHKKLLVFGEQGFGDVIQFSRFIPFLISMGVTVVLQVPTPLHRLFAGQWPDLILVDSRIPFQGDFDRFCSLMSLPYLLGLKSPPATPWLNVSKVLSVSNRPQKLRVGLVWAGLSVRDLERYTATRRSMGLSTLLPILSQDVSWVSLQLNLRPEDRVLMAQYGIEDLSEQLTDFYETAQVMQTLDLLISIDTSVIHLAGAMGVPSWVILPMVTDYRWSGLSVGSIWYPDIRIFRQVESGNWSEPIKQIALALGQKFG